MATELSDSELLKVKREFHLKEWESLRQEISDQVDHTRKLEFGLVAGLGAFYAWFATTCPSPPHFILVIPTLLAFLGGIRAWGTLIRIQEIACYIKIIESHFSIKTDGLIGWDSARPTPQGFREAPFKYSATMFWVATVVVSMLAWICL